MKFNKQDPSHPLPGTRRTFLKTLALAAVAVGSEALPRIVAASEVKPSALLAEATGADHAALVRQTVGKLGGMAAFVKPGHAVTVKPNIGWDRTPEEAANTNPVVVKEVVVMCLEAGASKVMVFDRTCNDARRCYKNSGIKDAVESIGDKRVEIGFVNDIMFETVEIPGGVALTRWPLYKPALRSDAFINVPVLKHHGLSTMTAGMKNLMGIMGANRGNVHRQMGDSLVDLNIALKSTLTIIDATRILVANGPQGGGTENVRAPNRLCASTDVVAADVWAAKVFGLDPMNVPYLKAAAARNFGCADPRKVRFL